MSVAAWSSNVELNIIINLNENEYRKLVDWYKKDVIGDSDFLDMDWITSYKENSRKPNVNTKKPNELDIRLNGLKNIDLSFPRKQLKAYTKNKLQFVKLVKDCANKKMSKDEFYNQMWLLLKDAWYGTPDWCRSCKKENWTQACVNLLNIFSANDSERDKIVKEAIDNMQKDDNPIRGAWFSEILCHHYPHSYPLINNPVKKFMRKTGFLKIWGIPDSNTYLKATHKLRKVLYKYNKLFHNFGEMDHAIWEKSKNEIRRAKQIE